MKSCRSRAAGPRTMPRQGTVTDGSSNTYDRPAAVKAEMAAGGSISMRSDDFGGASTSTTFRPFVARMYAAVAPAGPAPTTTTRPAPASIALDLALTEASARTSRRRFGRLRDGRDREEGGLELRWLSFDFGDKARFDVPSHEIDRATLLRTHRIRK